MSGIRYASAWESQYSNEWLFPKQTVDPPYTGLFAKDNWYVQSEWQVAKQGNTSVYSTSKEDVSEPYC